MSAKEPLGTYYIGATIADVRVLSTVRDVNLQAKAALSIKRTRNDVTLRECHMTLVPPFHTTYEEATRINLSCYQTTIFCQSLIMDTQFSLGKMMTLIFEGSTSLCFSVVINDEENRKAFLSYVATLRRHVVECDLFNWRDNIPSVFRPHVTILNAKDVPSNQIPKSLNIEILWNKKINKIVLDHNNSSRRLPFMVVYPTIYAKYKHGWQALSYNPVDDV